MQAHRVNDDLVSTSLSSPSANRAYQSFYIGLSICSNNDYTHTRYLIPLRGRLCPYPCYCCASRLSARSPLAPYNQEEGEIRSKRSRPSRSDPSGSDSSSSPSRSPPRRHDHAIVQLDPFASQGTSNEQLESEPMRVIGPRMDGLGGGEGASRSDQPHHAPRSEGDWAKRECSRNKDLTCRLLRGDEAVRRPMTSGGEDRDESWPIAFAKGHDDMSVDTDATPGNRNDKTEENDLRVRTRRLDGFGGYDGPLEKVRPDKGGGPIRRNPHEDVTGLIRSDKKTSGRSFTAGERNVDCDENDVDLPTSQQTTVRVVIHEVRGFC